MYNYIKLSGSGLFLDMFWKVMLLLNLFFRIFGRHETLLVVIVELQRKMQYFVHT